MFAQSTYEGVKNILLPILVRVTHYNDIVPRLPLALMNFRHIGTEIHYPLYNNIKLFNECKDTQTKESSKCINSVITFGIASHLQYLGVRVSRQCGFVSGLDAVLDYLVEANLY